MERRALLYDADCGLCLCTLSLVLAWDRAGRLRPVALQDAEAKRLLVGMDSARRMSSWHLVVAGGEVRSAGAALGPLLALLPGARPLGALAVRFPGAAERMYQAVADRRSQIGALIPGWARQRARARIAERR